MGKIQRAVAFFWVPQYVVLFVAVILLVNAANPQTALPVLVNTQARSFIVPASDDTLPTATLRPLAPLLVHIPPAQNVSPPPGVPKPGTNPISNAPIDCTARPCIALSFDDGPMPPTTDGVLDILEQEQVRASFFLIGKNIAGHEAEVQRMTADGFEIGNHTWSHTDMTTLTPQQVKDELVKTQLAIVDAGGPAPTLFRPPYGAVDPAVVAQAGLQTALWNEDPRDWQATDLPTLIQTIVGQAQPGGIIDMHDTHQITVDALRPAIDQLKARGFQFVTVTQLMRSRIRPGTAPFYGYNAGYYHFPPSLPPQ